MRSPSLFSLSMAAILAGATVLSLAVPVDGATAQNKKKKKSEKPDVSREFLEPFNVANEAIESQDIATAEAKLAEAAPNARTPDEQFFLGNATARLGGLKQDSQMQRRGLELMVDSGKAPPEALGNFNYLAGALAYEAKDYAAAEKRFKASIDTGFSEKNVNLLYVDSVFRQNRVTEGLQLLRSTIDRMKAAGLDVTEDFYRSGVRASNNAGMTEEGTYWSQQWVANYPSETSWREALILFRQNASFPNAINIDLMRLMRANKSLVSEADYSEYIENADPRRLPGEVLAVIQEGSAKGDISTSNPFFSENLSMAQERVADDRSSLDSSAAEAKTSSNPVVAIGTADAYLGYGEYAKAAELYTMALGKPGADADLVNTRLGIANAMQGNYAAAKDSFAKVNDVRKPLADFWMIWIDQQGS
ncbi:MAG: hypothetical protein AAFX04_06460 [Pseudomonadota bacterium]